MQNKVQSDDNKYSMFTEMVVKTDIISSLTYWKYINNIFEKWGNILIPNKLVEKTT